MNEYINRSLSFTEYLDLIDRLLLEGKTTGPVQSDSMLGYARVNRARIQRLMNTIELEDKVSAFIRSLDIDWVWLIITEGWCGDAAQNIPVIEKIAAANSGIETRYILRDENPELMDRFLTNGSRSIPKLIAVERKSNNVLGTWGPRPELGQQLFNDQKTAGVDKPLILENLQRWYHQNRGRSIQAELADLSLWWAKAPLSRAA
jgi:hypothetical protein